MKDGAHFNRASRKSGGDRKVRIFVPNLTAEEIAVAMQLEIVRIKFSEAGVKKYIEQMKSMRRTPPIAGRGSEG